MNESIYVALFSGPGASEPLVSGAPYAAGAGQRL